MALPIYKTTLKLINKKNKNLKCDDFTKKNKYKNGLLLWINISIKLFPTCCLKKINQNINIKQYRNRVFMKIRNLSLIKTILGSYC